jgi:hypothetical protein
LFLVGFFFILPLAYSQNDATDLDVRRLKTRGFGQGSAFWGSQFQKITFRGRRPSKTEKLYRRQWGILGQNEIQPQPLNGFRRATAQTTWFRPRKCILGVTNLGRNTWGRCPPKTEKVYRRQWPLPGMKLQTQSKGATDLDARRLKRRDLGQGSALRGLRK